MNIIIWLVVGGGVGWLGGMRIKSNDQQGVVLKFIRLNPELYTTWSRERARHAARDAWNRINATA